MPPGPVAAIPTRATVLAFCVVSRFFSFSIPCLLFLLALHLYVPFTPFWRPALSSVQLIRLVECLFLFSFFFFLDLLYYSRVFLYYSSLILIVFVYIIGMVPAASRHSSPKLPSLTPHLDLTATAPSTHHALNKLLFM